MAGFLTANTAIWLLLATVVTACFTTLGIWFKHGPDRFRAQTEAETSERTDYAAQVKEFRAEVHKYKNEVQMLQGELMSNDRKITMMEVVIELLIADAERINPGSPVVRQANLMMLRIISGDSRKSAALNSAEHAVRDAEQSVKSAEATCREVRSSEVVGDK